MTVTSDKHGKKRLNVQLEDQTVKASKALMASTASAGLSRKKLKANSDDIDGHSTQPTPASSELDIAGNVTNRSLEHQDYTPFSLNDIRTSIINLCTRVPIAPSDDISPDDAATVYEWASQMQAVIEEFNLLLCCVAPATYKWGSDRSGAADQNLTCLCNELSNAQDQISSSISSRLSNVLAPVVDIVIKTTTIETNTGTEGQTRTNTFSREVVDTGFLKLNYTILCRNARMLRQVMLANFHKVADCIRDYLDAAKKDNQNDHQRSFAY